MKKTNAIAKVLVLTLLQGQMAFGFDPNEFFNEEDKRNQIEDASTYKYAIDGSILATLLGATAYVYNDLSAERDAINNHEDLRRRELTRDSKLLQNRLNHLSNILSSVEGFDAESKEAKALFDKIYKEADKVMLVDIQNILLESQDELKEQVTLEKKRNSLLQKISVINEQIDAKRRLYKKTSSKEEKAAIKKERLALLDKKDHMTRNLKKFNEKLGSIQKIANKDLKRQIRQLDMHLKNLENSSVSYLADREQTIIDRSKLIKESRNSLIEGSVWKKIKAKAQNKISDEHKTTTAKLKKTLKALKKSDPEQMTSFYKRLTLAYRAMLVGTVISLTELTSTFIVDSYATDELDVIPMSATPEVIELIIEEASSLYKESKNNISKGMEKSDIESWYK